MNVQELRVGNWIEVYNFSDVQPTQKKKVTGILPDGSLFFEYTSGYHRQLKEDEGGYVKFTPINLSNQILEKVGFEDYYKDGKYRFREFSYYDGCLWFGTSQIEIKYLHKLQDAIFILGNQELQISF